MDKKVAILQSNYLPWKGYFDVIHEVDTFVLLDNVQYTKNDWRNRNRIPTRNGLQWLTVPVLAQGHSGQLINEARVKTNVQWQRKHWQSILQNYQKAPFFEQYRDFFHNVFLEKKWEFLSDLNQFLIVQIATFLGIDTRIVKVEDLNISLTEKDDDRRRTERVIKITQSVGGTLYLSGPAAQCYIQEDMFDRANIELSYKDYSGYPVYSQVGEVFEHSVSILDLLFLFGGDAGRYIWGWRDSKEKVPLGSALP